MNKYILLLLISMGISLSAKELNILEFRHQQKVLTLNSFKELFIKRNLASHRRKLKLKYNRVKELHSSNIISKMRVLNSKIDVDSVEQTTSSVLQIKSNNELEESDKTLDQITNSLDTEDINNPSVTVVDTKQDLETETETITSQVSETNLDNLTNVDIVETIVSDIDEEGVDKIIGDDTKEDLESEMTISDEILQENNTENIPIETGGLMIRSLGENPWNRR